MVAEKLPIGRVFKVKLGPVEVWLILPWRFLRMTMDAKCYMARSRKQ